jgi:hypothetical protein
MEDGTIETHLSGHSSIYEVKIEGNVLFLYHCPLCGRDFARGADEAVWRAARIGTFRVDFLPDEQWVSEPCPGIPSSSQSGTFNEDNSATSGSLVAVTDSISPDPPSGDASELSRPRGRPRTLTKR